MNSSLRPDKILHAGRFLRLVSVNGWEYVDRIGLCGIVAILAVTEEGKLILTEQYRPPVGARVIELPAGLAGDGAGIAGEPLEQAARRELWEETGYEADHWERVTEGATSAGLTSEIITLFRASRLRRSGPGGGDAQEAIRVHEVPLPEAPAWLKARQAEGLQVDYRVYAGLWLAANKE
jgi:ADP-ribose pyrophosphatase